MECRDLNTETIRTRQNPELTAFAGRLAHEITDICTAVTGNLTTLEPYLSPEGRAAYIAVRRTLERSDSLICKLKAMAERQDLVPETFDPGQHAVNIAEARRLRLPPTLRIDYVPYRDKLAVVADRRLFRAALIELLNNACDAMNGRGHISIATESVLHDGKRYARISVTDYGPGMSAAQAGCAMEPLVTTKACSTHRGWGLAVCDGFVRQSGGFLEILSAPHRGTTVSLHFPLAASPGAEGYPRLHVGE